MSRKINVVSLSDIKPVQEDTHENNSDVENISQELNQIKAAIKEEESLNPPEDKIMKDVKPKSKRKTPLINNKKNKIVEEVAEQIVESVVEVKDESTKESSIEEPHKKVKTLELVKCPKCDKEMTKRTLRYDHDKSCKGAPVKREDIPVQKRVKKVFGKQPSITVSEEITEQPPKRVLGQEVMLLVEQEVKKRIQNSVQDRMHQRLKIKDEKMKKLAAQIA